MSHCTLLLALPIALVLAAPPLGAAAQSPTLLDEVVSAAGFSSADLTKVGDDVLTRELAVPDRGRDAAFAAVVRLATDGAGLGGGADLGSTAGRAQGVDAMGTFHDPVEPADVAALGFSDDELEVVADCEAADCKFKLGREAIERVRAIDWDSGGAGEQFTEAFRSGVLRYVESYRQRGDAALILYADKSEPAPIAGTLDRLLAQFTAFVRHAPEFTGYLATTPQGRRPSLRESILWSAKDFGYRPTISVDHVVVDASPEPEGARTLFASKTIYANHYLAGRIQMGVVLDGNVAFGIPGTFLLLVDRVEFDDALSGFKRSLLVRGLRSDLEGRMKRLRAIADGR